MSHDARAVVGTVPSSAASTGGINGEVGLDPFEEEPRDLCSIPGAIDKEPESSELTELLEEIELRGGVGLIFLVVPVEDEFGEHERPRQKDLFVALGLMGADLDRRWPDAHGGAFLGGGALLLSFPHPGCVELPSFLSGGAPGVIVAIHGDGVAVIGKEADRTEVVAGFEITEHLGASGRSEINAVSRGGCRSFRGADTAFFHGEVAAGGVGLLELGVEGVGVHEKGEPWSSSDRCERELCLRDQAELSEHDLLEALIAFGLVFEASHLFLFFGLIALALAFEGAFLSFDTELGSRSFRSCARGQEASGHDRIRVGDQGVVLELIVRVDAL